MAITDSHHRSLDDTVIDAEITAKNSWPLQGFFNREP
jgi:hypothetical protein